MTHHPNCLCNYCYNEKYREIHIKETQKISSILFKISLVFFSYIAILLVLMFLLFDTQGDSKNEISNGTEQNRILNK